MHSQRLAKLVVLALVLSLVVPVSVRAATSKCAGVEATKVGTPGNDVLNGTAGDDVINGLGGNDTIDGRGGADLICGKGGKDKIEGAEGDDLLLGGSGDDQLVGGPGQDFVSFLDSKRGVTASLATGRATGDGSDRMTGIEILGGSRQSDNLSGDDDQLNLFFGLQGNDSLFGGRGLDLVAGGPGNDRLEGQRGFDVADFAFSATAVNVNLNISSATGDGTDTLNGIEVVSGSPFDDIITGDGAANFLWGAAGNDQIFGLSGDDDLQGDAGDDMLDGGEGDFDFADYFFTANAVNASLATQTATGDGADQFANVEGLIGSSFDDTLTGGGGDEVFGGAGGNDTIAAGSGFDFVFYIAAEAGVTVDLVAGTSSGEGSDQLSGLEAVIGSEFNDSLSGDDANNALFGFGGNDTLRGLGGDDYFVGMLGDDTIEGGAGSYDLVDYGPSFLGVDANLDTGVVTGDGNDRLTDIEGLIGSIFDDTLVGDEFTNYLFGGDGDDVISGGDGDDQLTGDVGADAVDGGNGADSCAADDTKLHCETVGEPLIHPLIVWSNAYASAAATIRSKGIRSKG
ncbi:MAG TPA: hypothetical protein VHJ82_00990 [Actinomycetota bacterium]|nr:hypothetical protein [Actinomycetota bacterium]